MNGKGIPKAVVYGLIIILPKPAARSAKLLRSPPFCYRLEVINRTSDVGANVTTLAVPAPVRGWGAKAGNLVNQRG